jgi:tetratricopeptide (TPR) repeat protein
MSLQLKKYLLFFLLSSFVILLVLEIFLRLFQPIILRPILSAPAFGIPSALKANLHEDAIFNKKINYKIITNDKRLRTTKFISYTKPKDTFRILCIGDSIFLGYGVNNNEMFSYYLENLLNSNPNIKIEVITAATYTWSPVEFYLYLKNEGYKYSPDLIIMSKFIDDFSEITESRINFQNISYSKIKNGSQIKMDGGQITEYPQGHLISLFNYLLNNWPLEQISKVSFVASKIQENIRSMQLNLLKKFDNTAIPRKKILDDLNAKENEKISWLIPDAKFPILGELSLKQVQYYIVLKKIIEYMDKISSELLLLELPTYQEAYKIIPRATSNSLEWENFHKLNLFDDLTQFQSRQILPLYFPKDSHWTPAGHLFAAMIAYNYISKNIFKNSNIPIKLNSSETFRQLNKANERLQPIIESFPSRALLKALTLKNKGRHTEAIEELKKYLNIENNDPLALLNLGILYFETKRSKEAIIAFEKVLQVESKATPEPLFFLGKAFLELKQFKKALTYFLKTSKFENFNSREVFNSIAQTYFFLDEFDLAEKNWRLAIIQNPSYSGFHINLGILYLETQRNEKALREFIMSQKLSPKDPQGYLLAGLTYLKNAQLRKARRQFQIVLKLQPGHPIALSQLNQLMN